MRLLQNLPFKRKLTVISMLTSGAALLLACGAFIAYEQVAFRRDMARELEITAQIIGANSASSLSFDDNDSAALTLKSLAAQPHIIRGCVYDNAGKVFATYHRDARPDLAWPAPQDDIATLHEDSMDLFHVIHFTGDAIGTIYLQSDLHELHSRRWRNLAIAGGVLLAALLTTWLIASRLQRLISEPISQLAAIAGRVGAEKDYSMRAVKQGDDEIGRLIDGFNDMLAQIQARDAELHAAHRDLELRVEERTRSLEETRQEVSREKARFQFIFDHAPVGISLHSSQDGALKVRLINDAHLRICGVSREELQDSSIFEKVTHPEDYVRQFPLQQQLERGEIDHFSLEKRYLRAGGEVVWAVFSAQRRAYPDGRVETLVTVIDITELKRAQFATARERARFKFIFDSLPVGVSWRQLGDRGSVLINPAHDRITGVAVANGDIGNAFARATHPEDYARQTILVNKLLRGEIDHYVIEKRYVHPDGRTVWVVMTSRVTTDPDTGERQSVTTLVDITDLKLAQEETTRERTRFKFIFEALPVGVAWMIQGRRETRIVNSSFSQITGVPLESSQERGRYIEATHPDDRAEQQALYEKLKAGEIEQYTLEIRYRHEDGAIRWASLTLRFVRDSIGDEIQELTTLVDITERKRAEVELENLHKQLLHTSHQAGMAEVATGVLHNVGNVLNSVNVSATLVADLVRRSKSPNVGKVCDLLAQHRAELGPYLTEDPKGRMIPSYLSTLAESLATEQKTIIAELDSLHKNIGHIKDIVAMQQSYAKTSGVVETVSVPDMIEDAIRMNAGSLARHDVDVARDYAGRPVITVEKNKVLQILVNLIRNAKYACDESGRTDKLITIRTTVDDRGVDISVIDNGVGIPAENLIRIFAHGFTTRKHGHGFGLHSGALAAKELGGSLGVHSDGPGKGATFTLRVPFRPEEYT